jgi:hypothetical protein
MVNGVDNYSLMDMKNLGIGRRPIITGQEKEALSLVYGHRKQPAVASPGYAVSSIEGRGITAASTSAPLNFTSVLLK